MAALTNASLLRRLAAFVTDFFLLDFVIFSPFGDAISPYISTSSFSGIRTALQSEAVVRHLYPVALAVTILMVAYFSIFDYRYGQTPGKMLFRIKVISLTKKLTVGQCIVRSLSLIPLYFVTLIDIAFIFFNPDHQRVLEFLTKTKIVSEK